VTLGKAAAFVLGYVLGTRAGHERYAQIVALAEDASRRLEEFSARHPPTRRDDRPRSADPRR
jgi:hypothetical protein